MAPRGCNWGDEKFLCIPSVMAPRGCNWGDEKFLCIPSVMAPRGCNWGDEKLLCIPSVMAPRGCNWGDEKYYPLGDELWHCHKNGEVIPQGIKFIRGWQYKIFA
jgi:hypothetical protein